MLASFDELLAQARPALPPAGCAAQGAGRRGGRGLPDRSRRALLDPAGTLAPGAVLAPPEGDAGTGMAATNAVAARTGNVSAGTSVFAMAVLEKPLSRVYPEIDMVTTPAGAAGGHGALQHLHLRPGRLGEAAGPDGRSRRGAAGKTRPLRPVLPESAGG